MGFLSRIVGGVGAAVFAGITLVAVPSSAQAMAGPARVLVVPCDAAALAAAIRAANGFGVARLLLAPYCLYNYATANAPGVALPVVTGDTTLVGGSNTRIRRDPSASEAFRVLEVASGATLRVQRVAILGGSTAGLGGGILNAGTVVLEQATLSGNSGSNGGAFANNAGAKATISRSRLNANSATSVGGGAIINFGTLTVYRSALTGNSAPINGGALNTQPGGVSHLISSTVTTNTSGGLGGGISNLGTTKLDRVVVEGNTGSGGGGIATGNANVEIRNSIVRNNTPDNCSPLNTIPGCVG
ncbi:hypothetical protein [Nonomuraea cavernae]|uniref:Right handed beta helix domain-containing protein n=1 Tax=Nonomuraea cavernae TaxID=2045107 RepID=A0A918DFX8_9ACTN|nr:hypothetical protein [Nonomuraea cavernae]MCA2184227.1 hypothetical protein [Nonomuraea cavernae]GGO62704.1 hypothetical protein GCM10012289_07990 [Nonomuraea cavernae]